MGVEGFSLAVASLSCMTVFPEDPIAMPISGVQSISGIQPTMCKLAEVSPAGTPGLSEDSGIKKQVIEIQ